MRENRKPLLKAFDVYKSNISYGIISETEEERASVFEWYNKILNLDEDALNNVPESIKKYL